MLPATKLNSEIEKMGLHGILNRMWHSGLEPIAPYLNEGIEVQKKVEQLVEYLEIILSAPNTELMTETIAEIQLFLHNQNDHRSADAMPTLITQTFSDPWEMARLSNDLKLLRNYLTRFYDWCAQIDQFRKGDCIDGVVSFLLGKIEPWDDHNVCQKMTSKICKRLCEDDEVITPEICDD